MRPGTMSVFRVLTKDKKGLETTYETTVLRSLSGLGNGQEASDGRGFQQVCISRMQSAVSFACKTVGDELCLLLIPMQLNPSLKL
jgi:hypothetical protein